MDISLGAAQSILSIVVILAALLPVMYLTKNRKGVVIEVIILFLVEGFLIAMGWLPFWLFIGTVAMMSIAIASFGTKVIMGG